MVGGDAPSAASQSCINVESCASLPSVATETFSVSTGGADVESGEGGRLSMRGKPLCEITGSSYQNLGHARTRGKSLTNNSVGIPAAVVPILPAVTMEPVIGVRRVPLARGRR